MLCENKTTNAKIIVNSAFRAHNELVPSLLEKVYEACLVYEITKAGFEVKAVDIVNPV